MKLFLNIKRTTVLGLVFTAISTSHTFASVGLVTADEVSIRSSNSSEAVVVSKAENGEEINILSDLNGWFKISSPETGEAYVTSQFIKVTQADATVNSNSVNIRVSPSSDSEVIGKAAVGELLSVTGSTGDWYKIDYKGSVAYVQKDFLNGNMLKYLSSEADASNNKNGFNSRIGNVYATIACIDGLNMRKYPSTTSEILKAFDNGENLNVHDIIDGWIKVSDDSGTVGYVSSDYVILNNGTKPKVDATNLSKGKEIVAYAKQFLGLRYVYGGTSLTYGADCSGFTYSVFKHFGINLNRISREQISNGTQVSKSALQAGDLIFFNSGGKSSISHVGIYMGDGNYIHSTDAGRGCVTITSLSEPYSSRTYVAACRVIK